MFAYSSELPAAICDWTSVPPKPINWGDPIGPPEVPIPCKNLSAFFLLKKVGLQMIDLSDLEQ